MYSNDDVEERLSAAAGRLMAENEQMYISAQTLAVLSLTVTDGDVDVAEKLLHFVEEFIAATIGFLRSHAQDQPLLDILAGSSMDAPRKGD